MEVDEMAVSRYNREMELTEIKNRFDEWKRKASDLRGFL
jgi:hypothetical protein